MGVGGGDRPAWPGWSQGEDLTALEEQMVARAAVGELVDRGGGPFNLAEMQAWGEERTIRAVVLRHLLVAEQWPVDAKGVRLRGVRISGHLNLEAAVLRCPLSLDDCHLDAAEPACLDFATASRITMAGCQLAGLTGEMLTAREVDLSRSTFTGPLRLTVADITGQLNCRGARLAGRDSEGHALYADRLKAGAVYLSEGFTAPGGAVRLLGADITGPLICRGALLNGGDGVNNALAADGLKVGGGVFLDEGFTATGAVRLAGGHITGQLSCRDAQLIGCDDEDNALVADRLKASGGVFLDGKFTAPGAVRLLGADITGQLCCRGARLTGYDRDGNALVADWLKASGGVFLDKGFTAAGAVRLLGADITGQLECSGARLTGHDSDGCALVANGMRVTGEAFFTGLTAAGAVQMLAADIEGQLSFHGAHLNGRDNNDPALIADGMRVTNGAFFTGLTATGAVRMLAADIERQLTFQGAHLNGRDDRGDALAADGMKVRGSVLFNGVSTAIGAVRLPGADISGPLVCSDAQLTGRDQGRNALVADRMKVGSGVSLNGQFTADGAVRLAGADITGQLTCRGAQLNGCDDRGDALAAYGMRVSDDVYIDEGFTAAGTLSLVAARFGLGSADDGPPSDRKIGVEVRERERAQ